MFTYRRIINVRYVPESFLPFSYLLGSRNTRSRSKASGLLPEPVLPLKTTIFGERAVLTSQLRRFYPAMSSTTTWFFRKRAFALGIMAAGSSLGGVIFPIMVERIIAKAGFGWAMRASAFLVLGMLIYANLTVKSRIPPMPKPWAIMDFISPFKEMPFLLTVLASFLFFFGMFLPFTFIILSAEYNGMSANLAGYLLAVLNAVSIFGRTLPGFVADRVGRYNTMIVTSFLSTILVLALWLPARGNVPYILFAAFYGFSSGAFVSLAPALIAQISDIRQIGVRSGSMFMVISLAALCGNPIGGALIAAEGGNYLHLQIFCGVSHPCPSPTSGD